MLFGILAAVTTKHQDSGISGWDEFLIVVIGSIVAAAILAGVQWGWRRYRAPVLEVAIGDGYDYDKRIASTDKFARDAIEEHEACGAFGKFLQISETGGRSGASNVVIRLSEVVPHVPHTMAKVELSWADHNEANDIRPDGHKNAALLRIFFFKTRSSQRGWRCAPTFFDHADTCEFTVEVLIDNKPHKRMRVRMDNTWSQDRIEAWPVEAGWPPEGLKFPTVEVIE